MTKKIQTVTNGLKRLTISLLLGANLGTVALLWLCVLLTYVSPSAFPYASLLTLAFPLFLAADVLFLFVWLIFHARLAWVPILSALVVCPFILDYCPVHIGTEVPTDTCLTLISYNVGGTHDEETKQEAADYLRRMHADIVCLQEATGKAFDALADEMDYHVVKGPSLRLFSRYPVLGDTLSIPYPTRSNRSLGYWVSIDGDSVLVINNHLESNHLLPEEKDDYRGLIRDPEKERLKKEGRHLVGKLAEAARYRGDQADSVAAVVDRYAGYPIILCGDFNDSPISYPYQVLDRRLQSCYRSAGCGPGISYTQRAFSFRIDHAFTSQHWECVQSYIDRSISASDHYPLVVRLRRKVQ